jgi:hypothetical protein
MSTDTDTLMYWIRSYRAASDCDPFADGYNDKTYCFHRAREWAAHIIAKGQA